MEILIPLVVLVFSAILHEVMHGAVAEKLGDPTARVLGRITLNPIPHIDPIMSIVVPFLLIFSGSPLIFGAAKPVPVNPLHFKDRKKDMAIVSLFGPLTNIFLAVVCAQLLKTFGQIDVLGIILLAAIQYNLVLGIINLIPIPPLDGSKVFAAFMPDNIATTYLSIERYGVFILLTLLFIPIGGFSLGLLINKLVMFSISLLGI